MGAFEFKPNGQGKESAHTLMLQGNDGSWELYPPMKRMKTGKLITADKHVVMEIKPLASAKEYYNPQWLGNIVLIAFAVMVFFRLTYPRRFAQFFKAAASNKGMYQLMREWSPMNILSLVFSLMHTISFAFFIYAGSAALGTPISFINNWIADLAILSGITTFVVYGKYLTIFFLSWIFQLSESGRRYLANQIVFSFLFSLLLFPLLLSIIYNPSTATIITSGILMALLHAARLLRSFAIGLAERHIPLHYLFLYLCTLEIVPLVLLLKAVSVIMSGQTFT
jgi:hypothetical protein